MTLNLTKITAAVRWAGGNYHTGDKMIRHKLCLDLKRIKYIFKLY